MLFPDRKKTNRESKQPCNGTVFSILKEIIQTAVKYLARIVKVATLSRESRNLDGSYSSNKTIISFNKVTYEISLLGKKCNEKKSLLKIAFWLHVFQRKIYMQPSQLVK